MTASPEERATRGEKLILGEIVIPEERTILEGMVIPEEKTLRSATGSKSRLKNFHPIQRR